MTKYDRAELRGMSDAEVTRLSAEAWRRKRETIEREDSTYWDLNDMRIGTGACPLCAKHLNRIFSSCGLCPVMRRTGRSHCAQTPYTEFCGERSLVLNLAESLDDGILPEEKKTLVAAAQAEIDFLEETARMLESGELESRDG